VKVKYIRYHLAT